MDETEISFKRLADNAQDMIFRLSIPDGQYEYVSPASLAITGYAPEEIIATPMHIRESIHPDWRSFIEEQWGMIQDGIEPPLMEFQIIDKSGKIKWLSQRTTLVKDRTGKPMAMEGFVTDITERKHFEEALVREKLMSEEYINSLPGLFYVFDEKRFLRWNKEWHRITGYADEDLHRMYGPDFFEGEDKRLIEERMKKVFTHGAAVAEANIITKDGRSIPYYFTGLRRTINNKHHLVGLGIDITYRKRAEEEKLALERQVRHAQKLESLGVLAGGIAHDFNNLLMTILGNADLALDALSPMSPARGNIKEIEKASKRAADLSKQMLAYSGKGKFVVERIHGDRLVEEMAHLLEVSISKKVVLKYNFAENAPTFDGDVTQIRQVVLNLITNASEAIGDTSGVIALSTGAVFCDRAFLNQVNEALRVGLDEPLQEGIYAYIEVRDTGCGMDAETLEKIFDPFFTTKFTGRGLGMSAVLGIVRGHNGVITIQSQPGSGSAFKVLIPANDPMDTDLDAKESDRRKALDWIGSGTVLIADDEDTVCAVGRQMLERIGFEVLIARDGREALKLFIANASNIACVLLDLTMPHMDGSETFVEIRKRHPHARVILCSGYSEQDATKRFADKGLAGFIQKPYSMAALREKLKEVLDKNSK